MKNAIQHLQEIDENLCDAIEDKKMHIKQLEAKLTGMTAELSDLIEESISIRKAMARLDKYDLSIPLEIKMAKEQKSVSVEEVIQHLSKAIRNM